LPLRRCSVWPAPARSLSCRRRGAARRCYRWCPPRSLGAPPSGPPPSRNRPETRRGRDRGRPTRRASPVESRSGRPRRRVLWGLSGQGGDGRQQHCKRNRDQRYPALPPPSPDPAPILPLLSEAVVRDLKPPPEVTLQIYPAARPAHSPGEVSPGEIHLPLLPGSPPDRRSKVYFVGRTWTRILQKEDRCCLKV